MRRALPQAPGPSGNHKAGSRVLPIRKPRPLPPDVCAMLPGYSAIG